MKLFTAMESYHPHSDATEEEMDELLESIGNQQRETAMMLETYSDATEALKNLKRVEQTKTTDRGVYRVTMESLADQLGYPAGSTFTSEGIGESISNFAKKVWAKIVSAWHAVRDWIRKLLGMSRIPSAAELEENERAMQAAVRAAAAENPVVEEVINNIDMEKTNSEIVEQHEKNLAEIMDNGNLMDILRRKRNIDSVIIRRLFREATEHLSKEQRDKVALPVLVHATIKSKYQRYTEDMVANLYTVSGFEAIKRIFKDTEKGTPNNEEVVLKFEGSTIKSSGGFVKSIGTARDVDGFIAETTRGTPEILHKQILWVKMACDNVGDLLSHAVDKAFEDEKAKLQFGGDVGYEIELLTYKLVAFRDVIRRRDDVSRALKGEVDPNKILSTTTKII